MTAKACFDDVSPSSSPFAVVMALFLYFSSQTLRLLFLPPGSYVLGFLLQYSQVWGERDERYVGRLLQIITFLWTLVAFVTLLTNEILCFSNASIRASSTEKLYANVADERSCHLSIMNVAALPFSRL